jgi:hypothetical protein
MVETTRTPYIPYSFGDLMEGRLRRVGDPAGSDARTASPAAAASTGSSASSAGGRTSQGSSFQRDLTNALSDTGTQATSPQSSSTTTASPSASTATTLSDGELELRARLAKVVGASAGQVSVKELAGQDTGRTSGTRQYIVTVDPAGSGGPAEAAGVNHTLSLPMAADAADFDYDAISMVKDRLNKMGIPTNGIQFDYWDDVINNVGGHRTFSYISADLGNGIKENFSLEWTLYNPDVTAVEIARLLRMGGGTVS